MNNIIYWSVPLARIGFSFIVGLCVIGIFRTLIRILFNNLSEKSRLASYKKRLDTLRSLIDNIISVVIMIIVVLLIFKDFGFDITPILASAGIAGFALTFGAQSLVKDLIAGFFIITENQYNVGDTIEVDKSKGVVSRINLRTTVIKDSKGNKIFLPNSKIEKVIVFKQK